MKKYLRFSYMQKNLFLVAVIVIGVYMIWDKIISAIKGKPFKNLNDFGSTISNSEATAKANALYTAMHGYGTDEELIYNTLEGITRPNFNKVYNAFNEKLYSSELGLDGTPLIDKNQNLHVWLLEELNESEIAHLKKIAPNVF